ncbi:engulfment and cell motility protein-like protein 2 [Dothidotthia symphoricarpi CBS 119687]|uniref:Engulfment and cell motility protein-like protein 2 n=1 Tax=Dothidotthia symphoricarpi CBS 119687 TaxID=1392245 RepID=A0A6A6AP51_9PLEO|nr:engulfment and cell motility protein-like protein 2 [Dothidotthia symphoricarpi CBS 119687]KAF2132963.1 engulfment and cell motility protein-like protein 2 [Dothidotthia symphoricarpi CBS 119687]
MDSVNVSDLVARLGSEEESVRKMAVFKLQSAIGDPSFADVFIYEGGLPKLRFLALHSTGNTLAYCLTSLARLLELDKGWDHVTDDLVVRIVDLVVAQPLVNVNRGAMSVLAAIVGHPSHRSSQPSVTGFQRLRPAVDTQPQFLPALVEKITSADHALCANSLQLINALMRDAIANHVDFEAPKFMKQLQELGVIKSVYGLMQSSAVQDLAHPLLEFQSLTKILLRNWRDEKVDLEKPDHDRAVRGLHTASNPTKSGADPTGSKKQLPVEWRRLGFDTESPAQEFEVTGFLGLMDLTDFVFKNEDGFQKLLLEQESEPLEQRCPIARASLSMTSILYEHFDVDTIDDTDSHRHAALDSRAGFERAFKPLLLHWSRLHTSGLNAFIRLWKTAGAQLEDFEKMEELVRILIEQAVGQAPRTREVQDVEEELAEFDLKRLRELQMELLELTYEDVWGHHLRQSRDELNHEALQFIKEQRIRCLLQGAWFPIGVNQAPDLGPVTSKTLNRGVPSAWRFVRLSHNRRYLHYADFSEKTAADPRLDALHEKIDLSIVSSVVSNVSASAPSTSSSENTVTKLLGHEQASTSTKITIHGYLTPTSNSHSRQTSGGSGAGRKESVLLQLHPQSHTLASEWLDGLLMLLNQQPITADTNKLVDFIGGYGLKIRLLNVRFEDVGLEEPVLPSRETLDDEYYYDIAGA